MGFLDKYPYTNWHNVNLDWVLERVKEWGQMVENNDQAFKDLEEANASFKEYVTNYLDTEFDENMNDLINSLLNSGDLVTYFIPYIDTSVTQWLGENVTQPTTPIIDTSLTISGAGADSKTTGDKINYLTDYIRTLITNGLNLNETVKTTLLQYLEKLAFVDISYGRDLYNALYNALNTYPILYITAEYSNPNNVIIYNIDTLDTIKNFITVTAHYSNGSIGIIDDYIITGNIHSGTSSFIINYLGFHSSVNIPIADWYNISSWQNGDLTKLRRIGGAYTNENGVMTFGLVDSDNTRRGVVIKKGAFPYIDGVTKQKTIYYPIPRMASANNVTINVTNYTNGSFALRQLEYNPSTGTYTGLSDSGWKENNTAIQLLSNCNYINLNLRADSSNGNFTYEPTVIINFGV